MKTPTTAKIINIVRNFKQRGYDQVQVVFLGELVAFHVIPDKFNTGDVLQLVWDDDERMLKLANKEDLAR